MVQLDMPNGFISEPVFHNLWDEIQDMNPKTLACVFIVSERGKSLDIAFQERVDITPVHLKIEAWHKKFPKPEGLRWSNTRLSCFCANMS